MIFLSLPHGVTTTTTTTTAPHTRLVAGGVVGGHVAVELQPQHGEWLASYCHNLQSGRLAITTRLVWRRCHNHSSYHHNPATDTVFENVKC